MKKTYNLRSVIEKETDNYFSNDIASLTLYFNSGGLFLMVMMMIIVDGGGPLMKGTFIMFIIFSVMNVWHVFRKYNLLLKDVIKREKNKNRANKLSNLKDNNK